ncbi:hypothetical protein AB1Y20_012473 [Prymnesium parvum]|uniref:Hemerythrin-like domain-containing protein n=1 Tax=Prymnesium parvum TaxID=97485 RepID=A0AB34IKY2_PRYPA
MYQHCSFPIYGTVREMTFHLSIYGRPLSQVWADSTQMLRGLSTKQVNPSDTSFQADPRFPPDKTPLWKTPLEQDGWIRAHDCIRAELDTMKTTFVRLGSKPLTDSDIRAIQAAFAVHYTHIIDHHENEDAKVMPFMSSRVKLPEKLTSDHKEMMEYLEKLVAMVNALEPRSWIKDVLGVFKTYVDLMLPHLCEEEKVALPLLRAYFTPKEFEKIISSILKESPPLALGSFWYWLEGKRGDKSAIMKFMAQEGIPWFVYYLVFKGQVADYEAAFVEPLKAVETGKPWVPKPKRKLCC